MSSLPSALSSPANEECSGRSRARSCQHEFDLTLSAGAAGHCAPQLDAALLGQWRPSICATQEGSSSHVCHLRLANLLAKSIRSEVMRIRASHDVPKESKFFSRQADAVSSLPCDEPLLDVVLNGISMADVTEARPGSATALTSMSDAQR